MWWVGMGSKAIVLALIFIRNSPQLHLLSLLNDVREDVSSYTLFYYCKNRCTATKNPVLKEWGSLKYKIWASGHIFYLARKLTKPLATRSYPVRIRIVLRRVEACWAVCASKAHDGIWEAPASKRAIGSDTVLLLILWMALVTFRKMFLSLLESSFVEEASSTSFSIFW